MDSKKVIVRKTKDRGLGIFAESKIKKNEPIASFDGAIYGWEHNDWNDEIYNHVIQFEKRRWRASKGIAKLFNHSCDPNCGIHGLFTVVAMRDIAPGEELTWDYAMTENYTWSMKCTCGSPLCRKRISRYDDLPKATKEKYKGYISRWLVAPKKKTANGR